MVDGAAAQATSAKADQHFTEPPPRYSEASLVKKLEELGIGRPSTYASILSTLMDREYVRMEKNRFYPEDKGRLVTAFLEKFFARYVEFDFTAALEGRLDQVSAGDLNWKVLLRDFWTDFKAAIEGTAELRITHVLDALNEALGPHIFPDKGDGSDPRTCPSCGEGKLSIRLSKNGAFIGCSNYPECRFTRPVSSPDAEGGSASGDRELGADPETGKAVHLKIGRFGPYVETAADAEGDKPRRSSLPKGWSPQTLELEQAVRLLKLPRLVGNHPEDGKPIQAGLGRYGPFILHDGTYANVADIEEVFDIGLNRAVDLLAVKRAGGRGGRGAATEPLKDLGAHPETGEAVKVMAGRFGPYVKCGSINATLPKGTEPTALTMDEAVKLIAERAAKGPSKGKGGRKTVQKAAKPKAAANPKAAAKKKAPAKKKPATKKANP